MDGVDKPDTKDMTRIVRGAWRANGLKHTHGRTVQRDNAFDVVLFTVPECAPIQG